MQKKNTKEETNKKTMISFLRSYMTDLDERVDNINDLIREGAIPDKEIKEVNRFRDKLTAEYAECFMWLKRLESESVK